MDKRGIVPNIIIGLGIFTAAIIISASFFSQKVAISDRILGQDQAAVHLLGIEGQGALLYLDHAARLAAAKTKHDFEASGGLEEDYEGGGYPCGQVLGNAYWYNDGKTCIPSFLETLKNQYQASLVNYLNAHPSYHYPGFTYDIDILPDGRAGIRGKSVENLLLGTSFDKNNLEFYQRTSFTPDYPKAVTPTTLNHGSRGGKTIQNIVVHYTVTVDGPSAINVLQQRGVSYHYIIDHDGTVYQLVPESKSAWHGGCSVEEKGAACRLPGMNQPSIGISFANCGFDKLCQNLRQASICGKPGDPDKVACSQKLTGTYYEAYDDAQIQAFIDLVTNIIQRNPQLTTDDIITRDSFLMHSEIITEKYDPGPLFEEQFPDIISRINEQLGTASATAEGQQETLQEATPQPQTPEEQIAAIAEERQFTPQTLSKDEKLIGPVNFCTGREAPASNTYATRINQEAFNSNGQTYLQAALAAGLEEGVDPALLITHMIWESSMGQNNKCTSAGKTALTGCKWYAAGSLACSEGCACDYPEVYSDKEQLACTAQADKNAYKEALTGQDTVAGQYDKCNDYADNPTKMWTCMLCIYQGNFDKDITNSGKPYFLQDGTCDYAENFKDIYCSWHAYIESSGAVTNYQVTGTYGSGKQIRPSATYTLPLSFQEIIDVDLNKYQAIKEFTTDVITECPDNQPQACLDRKLIEHNNQQPEYRLTTDCDENGYLQAFMKQYTSCLERPIGMPCSIYVDEPVDNAFFLRLRLPGITEVVSKRTRNIDGTASREILKNYHLNFIDRQGSVEQKNITLGFSGGNDPKLDIYLNNNFDPLRENLKLTEEHPLIFTKDDQNNTYLDLQTLPEQAMPAANTSFLVCEDKVGTNETGLSFALNLEDPLPPPVEDLVIAYHKDLGVYELKWTPATHYKDGKPVRDIMRYEIYCSPLGTLKTKQMPLSFDLSKTITRKDGKPFPYELYAAQGSMSILIDACGLGASIGEGDVQIAVIPKDASGQFSFNYTVHEVSPSILDNLGIPPINSLLSKGQQAQEHIEPPLGALNLPKLPLGQLQPLIPVIQRYFLPDAAQEQLIAQYAEPAS